MLHCVHSAINTRRVQTALSFSGVFCSLLLSQTSISLKQPPVSCHADGEDWCSPAAGESHLGRSSDLFVSASFYNRAASRIDTFMEYLPAVLNSVCSLIILCLSHRRIFSQSQSSTSWSDLLHLTAPQVSLIKMVRKCEDRQSGESLCGCTLPGMLGYEVVDLNDGCSCNVPLIRARL